MLDCVVVVILRSVCKEALAKKASHIPLDGRVSTKKKTRLEDQDFHFKNFYRASSAESDSLLHLNKK